MENLKGKKVFVGLSGGVDSAVTAALLKQAGAQVVGVFIRGWYPPDMPCTWSEDRRDAMRAAAKLGIPFYTLDASKEYKEGVIDYLLAEYAVGRTPNPDIMCNREVKFGAFYRFAMEHQADFIATGHYAQNVGGRILRGVDSAKDQSYFLWAVPKEALLRTLFPVGSLEKSKTRALASEFDVPQAAKKDSQGICFLGSISVDDFLRSEIGSSEGVAIDINGKEVGRHEGAVLATLGERVSLKDALPGPWYVIAKQMKDNILVVSHEHTAGASSSSLNLTQTNWLTTEYFGKQVEMQYRYHGPVIAGTLSKDGTSFTPETTLPEPIAPGQSLVCYQEDELLGGGIIV